MGKGRVREDRVQAQCVKRRLKINKSQKEARDRMEHSSKLSGNQLSTSGGVAKSHTLTELRYGAWGLRF